MTGRFITFEGGEGVGKSTLIDRLYDHLKSEGRPVIKVREPGGTLLGDKIRLLLQKKEYHTSNKSELFLFLASRAQHVQEVIAPALKEGKIVLCDRFNDSTLAYQGAARKFDETLVRDFCAFASADLVPDLTLFLDLDPHEGLSRVKKAMALDRIEEETIDFHNRVRAAYLKLLSAHPDRIAKIDAALSPDAVFEASLKRMVDAL